MGVDPGLASTGLAVVAEKGGSFSSLSHGCLKTVPSQPFPDRLMELNRAAGDLIARYEPGELAIERLFFAKNAKTAMAVGQAQGAILLAAAGKGMRIFEYTPLQVKVAVTGDGAAGKGDVARMVRRIFRLDSIPRPADTADALAVAYCHLVSTRFRAGDA